MGTLIFDIQRFSIHDGPGIRTTVFFKGCPLQCLWCQNPESLRFERELAWSEARCIGAGECRSACERGAILFNTRPTLLKEKCDLCLKCADACPSSAFEAVGRTYTPELLVEECLKDRGFYGSDGGITLSGGEPLSHPMFLRDFLPLCKDHALHVVVETSGFWRFEGVEPVLPYIDLVLYDIKLMDNERHKRCTGQENSLILENLQRLVAMGKSIEPRMPVIPTYNDDEENISATAAFLKPLGLKTIRLLPYHALGESKLKKIRSGLRPLGLKGMRRDDLKGIIEAFAAKGLLAVTY